MAVFEKWKNRGVKTEAQKVGRFEDECQWQDMMANIAIVKEECCMVWWLEAWNSHCNCKYPSTDPFYLFIYLFYQYIIDM